MQNTAFLNANAITVLNRATQHAKKSYFEGRTSIGAILKTKSGKLYTGINVKYKNVWKCVCAERVAIAKAIEAKNTIFDLIVSVRHSSQTNTSEVVNMCGECIQIAINHPTLNVIVDHGGILKQVSIKDVFPYPYI